MSRTIGDLYQAETKYDRDSLGGAGDYQPVTAEPFKEYPDAIKIIALPDSPPAPPADFWECLKKRRSERDYRAEPISFDELAALVFATQGVTGRQSGYLFRTAPSAGGLFPVETYLLVNRVDSLPAGIYHLNVLKNTLELIRAEDLSGELTSSALGQGMVRQGAVTFIWTAVVGRSKWKYGERAYRYIYLDAGHIAQNLYLAATALGLGCCTIGALLDDEINRMLGVDGFSETVLYLGVAGCI